MPANGAHITPITTRTTERSLTVWLLQIGEPLPLQAGARKMRTALVADALAARGHRVVWWTSAFDHFSKSWMFTADADRTLDNGVLIKALKGIGYRKNISLRRFLDHRLISRKFRSVSASMPAPDIIVASTPTHDLACEAAAYASRMNVPVIIDIRDPWPDIFLDSIPHRLRGPLKLVLFNEFRSIRQTLRRADGIFAVTEHQLQWGLRYAGRERAERDKVYSLGYHRRPIADRPAVLDKFKEVVDRTNETFNVFFVGTISRSYHNPMILAEAARALAARQDIHFIIAGSGELLPEMKRRCAGLTNITFVGWLNAEEIQLFLDRANVGICPASKVTDLPTNKAFSYLSAGIPIISSFHGDLKDTIERLDIGLYYPPNDETSLTRSILRLKEDTALHQRLSRNALSAFETLFNADTIYADYARHVETIACAKTGYSGLG
ncbi:MAG: glycosyltransferase [Nitrospirota bacterium]